VANLNVRERTHRHISCQIYHNIVVYLNYSNLVGLLENSWDMPRKQNVLFKYRCLESRFYSRPIFWGENKNVPPPISPTPRFALNSGIVWQIERWNQQMWQWYKILKYDFEGWSVRFRWDHKQLQEVLTNVKFGTYWLVMMELATCESNIPD